MKKYIFIFLTGLSFSAMQAQEIRDALRYSQDNLNGTARYRAMGGAFGALGGDLSSINVNPAGSAIFVNNQFGVTLTNNSNKNDSDYFGNKTTEKDNNFKINQAGGVFVFNNQSNSSKWKKISVGVNYENANNFNNATYSAGTNANDNSIDGYFLSYADGVPLKVLEDNNYRNLNNNDQQAYLGYNGYIINPATNDREETLYNSNVPGGGNFYQQNAERSEGYNGKLSFNVATSYEDKLFIGLNLNSHFTDYRRFSSFYEINDAPLSTPYTITDVRFDNELYTYGSGFSFQVGAIAKVTNELRAGLAYESSTWYRLNDEFTQDLFTTTSSTTGADRNNPLADAKTTNVYDVYKLQTPSKVTGSLAYIFGKTGLISVDYAIKDYSKTKFKPENDAYYTSLNNSMGDLLDNTSELRIGAEYKIKELSLRAGYRYEQSPYKNESTIGDLTGYSGGLGYNFGSTKIDLSYAYAERSTQQGFFTQGFTDGATINNISNNVSLTFLFEL
ncbi:outer membrane protein transport protein [Flavobacterium sp.]|uniref:OmpP1/FadL family transporter n=1 Tax=Flavobacterium sp. TaxID=239 RepID=UPI0026355AAE|nr:outer membrane protein transport protein [Flavobacterium sp.]MDG2433553.1 outer membrane protein transport protein [Flavobacterium sp.]